MPHARKHIKEEKEQGGHLYCETGTERGGREEIGENRAGVGICWPFGGGMDGGYSLLRPASRKMNRAMKE